MVTELRVSAYLVRAGEVLVYRRKIGGIKLFGGGVKSDETLRQAVRRELREELGVDVSVGALVSFSERFKGEGKERRRLLELIFMAKMVDETAQFTPEEGLDPEWIEMSGAQFRPDSGPV